MLIEGSLLSLQQREASASAGGAAALAGKRSRVSARPTRGRGSQEIVINLTRSISAHPTELEVINLLLEDLPQEARELFLLAIAA